MFNLPPDTIALIAAAFGLFLFALILLALCRAGRNQTQGTRLAEQPLDGYRTYARRDGTRRERDGLIGGG